MASIYISKVKVTPLTLLALRQYIASCIKSNQRVPILYANAHAINMAEKDAEFREILNAAPVVFCDGIGVWLAAKLLGYTLPERYTPPDWIDSLADICAQNGWRMFFLGSQDGVAQQAAAKLMQRYQNLNIASHHGYFDKEGPGNVAVRELINQHAPQVLVVGFGMPLQEKWIAANLAHLDVNVVMAVGALFDYTAGTVTRGPRWLTDHGFEWLCRLAIEPRRLWKRYLVGNPYFLLLIARQWWNEHSSH